ncbi:hypothetical protein PG999_006637 [Apiospora kogelbergensis]|uniref:Ankyrin repeat-containing protein n=1 Tax=Apiospora kogelbergensis TaxID=1337665 RepID=A0AAW0QW17_9PEZI
MDGRASRFKYNNPDGVPRDLRFTDFPAIFLANSGDEVDNYIVKRGDDVHEIFMGYNALQWHCDAVTTSPSTIRALVKHGIDINALDHHKLPNPAAASADECQHPPVARRTALGYACCNGNVKAVRTLLELGADPLGDPSRLPTDVSLREKHGDDTPGSVYPSPLQDLLSKQISGPTGVCPNKVHMDSGHMVADLNDKDVAFAARQGMLRMYGPVRKEPECKLCSYGFHARELSFANRFGAHHIESIFMTYKAQTMYGEQVYLTSYRTYECNKLLCHYAYKPPDPLLSTWATIDACHRPWTVCYVRYGTILDRPCCAGETASHRSAAKQIRGLGHAKNSSNSQHGSRATTQLPELSSVYGPGP